MIYSHSVNPLTILCHPRTHEPLHYFDGHLVALQSKDRFPIRWGIPQLSLPQTPFQHRFWGWVYNRVAFAYDWGVAVAWQWKLGGQPIDRQAYLEKIYLQPGDCVLETAVGTGTNIKFLPSNVRFVGLDISYNMLRRCAHNLKKWGRAAQLVQGDAQMLPFFDNVFDAVYHMGGLQFLTQPDHAFAEALRVTKPGGKIWMIDEAYSIPALLSRISDHKPIASEQNNLSFQQGIESLSHVLPSTADNVYAELISNGELYILSFRKKP